MSADFTINITALKKQIQDLSEITKAIRTCESQLMNVRDNLNNGSLAEVKASIDSLKARAEKRAVGSTQLMDGLKRAISYYEKAEQSIMSMGTDSGDVSDGNRGEGFFDKIRDMIDRFLDMLKGKEPENNELGGDPINFNTGNFIYDRTYLMSKGLFPLKFELNYNSLHTESETRKSVVGKDWTFQYGVYVMQVSDGMKVVWEDGHADYFKNVDGVYLPEYDTTKKITMTDDTIDYENIRGMHYCFSKETGLNTKITDANGNALYLKYDENERLLSVANDSEEGITFEYNEAGYICKATDHAGRTVSLTYDGEYLKSVTDELGNPFVFEYDENGHLATTVNALNVRTITNNYDASGRVVKQSYPDDTYMTLEYDDQAGTTKVTEQNKNEIVYRHDDRMRNVETTFEDGSIVYKYNDHNQKTAIIDKMGNENTYEYDVKGNMIRMTNPLGETMEFTYNDKKKVTSMTLCDKLIREMKYDTNGNLVEKKDALGNTIKIAHNKQGNPICVASPDGSKLLLTYDERGNISSITDPLGGTTYYTYDELNRVTSTVDAMDNRTEYEYDAKGHVVRVVKADGCDKVYTYNAGSLVTAIKDFNGAVTRKEYNKLNKLQKVILPDNGEIKFEYNEMMQISKRIDPNGAENSFEYNKLHRLVKATNAYGGTMRYEYDANGNQTKVISSDTGCVEYTYDALNRITSVKDADGSVSKIAYNMFGQKTKMTDALGHVREVIYNDAGQKVKAIDALGNETTFAYNEMGLLTEKVDPAGRSFQFEYLPGGILSKVIKPNGSYVSYKYNLNRQITSKITSEGVEQNFEYDSMGRMVKMTNSEGQVNQYEYDTMGNCIRSIDGNGNTTAYEYDIMNHLVAVVEANGNRTEYDYDSMGKLQDVYHCLPMQLQEIDSQNMENQRKLFMHYERDAYGFVTATTDALGNTIGYDYDEHGRVIRKTEADGTSTEYAYTLGGQLSEVHYEDGDSVYLSYNELKQLVEVKDWLGITTLELNEVGQPVKVTDSTGNEFVYERGVLGERKSLQYPDGSKVLYEYDDLNRLKELRTESGTISYTYDRLGRVAEKAFSNGTKSVIDYLKSGHIGSLAHYDEQGVLDSAEYKYDLVGNTVGIERFRRDMPEESGFFQYDYDNMNRLVGVSKDNTMVREYGYDAFGNRTSFIENDIRTDYFYDDANQLLKEVAPEVVREYAYDQRGNMRSVYENGAFQYGFEYDAKNRIKAQMNGLSGASVFEYDGMGHRISEQDYLSDSITFDNNMVNIADDLDPTKHISFMIDHAKNYNNLLMQKDEKSTKRFLWDHGFVGMLEADDTLFSMQDLNGSPMRLVDAEAKVMENYSYDEFGRDMMDSSENVHPFGYTGFYKDKVTATYFVQMRNYEPTVGRFTARDIAKGHLSAPFTSNAYNYCFNRPVDYADLTGAWPKWMEDIYDGACDLMDDIGDGIDWVIDKGGDVIQEGATMLFEGGYYAWNNWVPEPVRDFVSDAGDVALGGLRWTLEHTGAADAFRWFTNNTELGEHFMNTFDFYKTEDGVWHTDPDCWQQTMGYNSLYDYVFDGFTDMAYQKNFSFCTPDGTEYTLWMWKGDYYNLGAGCETGIYYGQPGDEHLNCATDTNLHMSITLYGPDGEMFTYSPEEYQWWITGFDPEYMHASASELTVVGSIDFSDNPELWEAMIAEYGGPGDLPAGYCIDYENMTLNYTW